MTGNDNPPGGFSRPGVSRFPWWLPGDAIIWLTVVLLILEKKGYIRLDMNLKILAAAVMTVTLAGCGSAVTVTSAARTAPSPPSCAALVSQWRDGPVQQDQSVFLTALGKMETANSALYKVFDADGTPDAAQDAAFKSAANGLYDASAVLIADPPPSCNAQFRADFLAAMQDVQSAAQAGTQMVDYLQAGDNTDGIAAADTYSADFQAAYTLLKKADAEA